MTIKEYPLTQDDLAEIGRRMARGEACYIPIRTDWGKCKNILTWGSPKAYEIVKVAQVHGVLYYGREKK